MEAGGGSRRGHSAILKMGIHHAEKRVELINIDDDGRLKLAFRDRGTELHAMHQFQLL